ncbi:unnamed protein product [Caenorhabditis angaria]|uniref:Serpentine Receptor, class H n=1 Tax=Caenorhabditis angaria TaxID=860376 RepID=A0A9P1MZL6_9PELO|nr:unnamed protein product [Caenorhabditis angaria]
MLNLHFWTMTTDILIGIFINPYMFFPVFVGIPTGIFEMLEIPAAIQTFFGQLSIGGLATSILMCFENRHNTLVRGRLKIEKNWMRYCFYGANGIYSILFLLPFYFQIPEASVVKMEFLKILPCPHPDYYLNSVFVFSSDISTVTLSSAMYLFLIAFQCISMSIHCIYYLIGLNKLMMSKTTKMLQKKFFLDLIWQISVPLGAVVLPMSYCFYSIWTEYYNQFFNNIAISLITLHGFWSTLVLMYLNPRYREYFLVVCFFKKVSPNIAGSGASFSMNPFSISRVV